MCGRATSTQCQTVIDGIYQAADDWNSIADGPDGTNVTFCQRATDTTAYRGRALECPDTGGNDGYTVTIKLADGDTPSSHDCINNSLACLSPVGSKGQAVENRTMWIKQPAYVYGRRTDGTGALVIWTTNPLEHNNETLDSRGEVATVMIHVQTVAKNEFGHAAGLDDTGTLDQAIYGDCAMSFSPSNMATPHTEMSECDKKFMTQNQLQNE